MCAAYLALALICTIPLFAQDKAATSEQKSETTAPEHKTQGELDVLSDTMGFDFSPYLNDVVQRVRRNWYRIIPESAHAPTMKKGNVSIEFAIMRDGTIRGMTLAGGLAGSAGDVALDRAAWGGITGSAPFPPLPDGSPGQYLALRMHFYYNPEKPIEGQAGIQGAAAYALAHGMKPIKDRTKVAIWMPSGSLRVAMGTSEHILAKVTGTTNTALKWSVSGPGCSGSACGTIVDGLYTAPSAVPSPPIVSVTATLECDRTATDSLPIRIVQPSRTAEGVLRVIDGRAKSQTASPTTDQKQPTPPSSTGPSSVGLCSHAPGAESEGFAVRYPWYVRVVQQKISENWFGLDRHIQSDSRIYLNFDIDRRGEPSNVRIEQSSGVPSLDESALRAVKNVSSFGPLPVDYKKDKVSVQFWFDYKPKQGEQKPFAVSPENTELVFP